MKLWPIWFGIGTALLLSIIFVVIILVTNWDHMDFSLNRIEQLGNSFGVLNAFFTGGAFFLVLWTLVIQQQELSLQREEMSRMVAIQQRSLHMDLLRPALEDKDLSAVWGTVLSNDYQEARRFIYVNLILTNWEMNFREGLITSDYLEIILSKYMRESEHFRKFWDQAGAFRKDVSNVNSREAKQFFEIANEAYLSAKSNINV